MASPESAPLLPSSQELQNITDTAVRHGPGPEFRGVVVHLGFVRKVVGILGAQLVVTSVVAGLGLHQNHSSGLVTRPDYGVWRASGRPFWRRAIVSEVSSRSALVSTLMVLSMAGGSSPLPSLLTSKRV